MARAEQFKNQSGCLVQTAATAAHDWLLQGTRLLTFNNLDLAKSLETSCARYCKPRTPGFLASYPRSAMPCQGLSWYNILSNFPHVVGGNAPSPFKTHVFSSYCCTEVENGFV